MDKKKGCQTKIIEFPPQSPLRAYRKEKDIEKMRKIFSFLSGTNFSKFLVFNFPYLFLYKPTVEIV